jgi:hypothetical protein
MNAPIASDTPSSNANAGDQEREPDAEDHEQLVVASVDDPADPRAAVARREPEHHEEPGRADEQQDRLARGVGPTEHGRERGEVQREEQVLDHDDAEDELGLRVVQAAQLHEQLGDDRRGRHARCAGDHQRLVGAPADGEPEREPDADVEQQVDARREREPPAARGELLDRELDPQVEEQEDQAERGEQLEVLGVAEEHRPRCERADEDAGEHEERDGGQADAPAGAAE